jgi:hypothetical protein
VLRDVQRLLLAALLEDDPVAALRGALDREGAGDAAGLTEQERRWLAALPEDGLRMSGLIVRKLRFERLTGGDHDLRDLFDRDPQAFLPLFRQFTSQVPPESYFPDEEARRFRQWKHRP